MPLAMRSRRRTALAALAIAGVGACTNAPRDEALAAIGVDPALEAFLGADFGGISAATLRTNALPYKVMTTALIMAEEARTGRQLGLEALPQVLTRFGFLYPRRVHGWPAAVDRPQSGTPIGLLRETIRGPVPGMRVEGVTIGCAACHTGTTYDADGEPTLTAWPGLPNTSLDVNAYVLAAYRGLQRADSDPAAFRRRVATLYPGMSLRERTTMRFVLQPAVRKRLAELRRAGDRPTPFSNGGPGRTNGVASMHRQLGLLADGAVAPRAVGFTSIPDLASRGLRSSLLYDGVYAPAGQPRFEAHHADAVTRAHVDSLAAVIAYFTIPTMGVAEEVAERDIPHALPVVRWLTGRYAPPPFPGRVDVTLAERGAAVFRAHCTSCHGRYADGPAPRRLVSFPNRLVPQAELRTDSARWAMVDSAFLRAIGATSFARYATADRTGGYVAPILSGLWATAPYLHNGSVPTLRALLDLDERPAEFPVGGHRLDFDAMGIALRRDADGTWHYPTGYVPWSTPERYDTDAPGLSNRGHERYTSALSIDQRRAVLEYLKQL